VADHFHVVGVGNRCLDKVRRRVQQETLQHRGRRGDPLYRIRKLLLPGAERLDQRGHDRMLLALGIGDPRDEVLGAWLAKESGRDIYFTNDPADAVVLVDKAIAGCVEEDVAEIQGLGRVASRDPGSPSDGSQQWTDRGLEPLRQKGEALRTGIATSSTTASECCSTPAASPGCNAPARRGSEPDLPTQTRRAH
jgi:hypothetical protein